MPICQKPIHRYSIALIFFFGVVHLAYAQLTQLPLPPSRMKERIIREKIIKQDIKKIKQMRLTAPERNTAIWFEKNRYNSPLRWIFLSGMPKGADLHNSLASGAYAENMLNYAAQNGKCINAKTYSVNDPPCHTLESPSVKEAIQDDELRNRIIDAWSMRDFPENHNSYAHYLSAFVKFAPAIPGHRGDILALMLEQAAAQKILYMEVPLKLVHKQAKELGDRAGIGSDYPHVFKRLNSSGLNTIIDRARSKLDHINRVLNRKLGCDSSHPKPGCYVRARFLYQVNRNLPPNEVFAQLVVGYELASSVPMVAGVNLSIPEDGGNAIRYYQEQMDMIAFLHKRFPSVHLSLTAGDLVQGLVPPDELTNHIQDALDIAHANRIEQGLDIAYETNPNQLINTMKKNRVLVLNCLATDNNFLNLNSSEVPLDYYLQHHIPIALATCDEGINRSDLTNEFEIASTSFNISYPQLKEFARNSLEYSFLNGQSLWANYTRHIRVAPCLHDIPGRDKPDASCKVFLADN
ncbi:MAG: hypothetical protein KGL58_04585, partial [Pseudomonadota bacterium]|nr:hypothetical protein [Pseudomonadota bacterium]